MSFDELSSSLECSMLMRPDIRDDTVLHDDIPVWRYHAILEVEDRYIGDDDA